MDEWSGRKTSVGRSGLLRGREKEEGKGIGATRDRRGRPRKEDKPTVWSRRKENRRVVRRRSKKSREADPRSGDGGAVEVVVGGDRV